MMTRGRLIEAEQSCVPDCYRRSAPTTHQQFPQPRDPLAREGHRADMKGLVMASAAPFPAGSPLGAEHRGNFAQRYPLTMFLVLAFAIGVPGIVIPLLLGVPSALGVLWLVFVALLGSSLLVTWLADGRAGVRKLLSRVVLWRFSAWRWAIILFAVPVLTVALAAASGTLTSPERGWAAEIGWYLFNTLIFGALTLNLWEETPLGRVRPVPVDGPPRAAGGVADHGSVFCGHSRAAAV
jgi:hypothetical protein